MNILVFNCGSSSLNYKVFQTRAADQLTILSSGKAHRVGVTGSQSSFIEYHNFESTDKIEIPIPDHRTAANLILDHLDNQRIQIDVIGHRFVHGGPDFQKSAILTKQNEALLQNCLPLAPIHNPNSMSVIEICKNRLPLIPQYLTFDTAFHSGLSTAAYTYALPTELAKANGWRKFGFHGLSYQFVSHEAAAFLGSPLENLKMIACHLGTGGSSAVAILNGKSLDTTMGFTPLPGLMMSTRTGDLDPLIPGFIIEKYQLTHNQLETIFNKKSGLLGVSGFSSDIRDIIEKMHQTADFQAALAFDLYTYRLRKTIGAFAALMNGVDVLIFTDDIGLQNPLVREAACKDLTWCGIELDKQKNNHRQFDQIVMVQNQETSIPILTMPTDEESVIGLEGIQLFKDGKQK